MKPYQMSGVGGGAPIQPVAMDPRGLVPVNRTQPISNDGFEPQRLMERRMGTMPPASFTGAGIATHQADRLTDMANAEMKADTPVGQPAPLSADANRAIRRQQMYSRENIRQAMLMRRQGGGLLNRTEVR